MKTITISALIIFFVGIINCGEVDEKKLHVVLNQKDGPVDGEYIVETTTVKMDLIVEILKDVKQDISWQWSRLMQTENAIFLIGNIQKHDDRSVIGVSYPLIKENGRWKLGANRVKIIVSN